MASSWLHCGFIMAPAAVFWPPLYYHTTSSRHTMNRWKYLPAPWWCARMSRGPNSKSTLALYYGAAIFLLVTDEIFQIIWLRLTVLLKNLIFHPLWVVARYQQAYPGGGGGGGGCSWYSSTPLICRVVMILHLHLCIPARLSYLHLTAIYHEIALFLHYFSQLPCQMTYHIFNPPPSPPPVILLLDMPLRPTTSSE